ncbi:MAG TPA: UDP-N-acetylmuramoyl-tripeptide--D-alanyl-D-alanine ligase [Gammaproteobacteria bacterium]|nr:UDP-N-acetylmuramoyl-tripeptide--D-alanyl-D-alanine ligase [Gammaproteobacteria bacterium]
MIAFSLKDLPAFNGISFDTRTLKPGNLYFAILGESKDGHDFVDQARRNGAAGAVVSKPVTSPLPTVQVEDTTKALGEFGKMIRDKFSIPLVGLTGSNGKTTTKNMIAAIFTEAGLNPLATEGNYNNQWGVPLMLSRLTKEHKSAVIEMGMNHFDEIRYLTHLAQPTIALITNAGPSHLEGVGGKVEGVAKAKGEIFEGLSKDGVAVINADDKFADFWKKLAGSRKIITFGLAHPADVHGEIIPGGFSLNYLDHKINIKLDLLGKHNIMNALAASAVGIANHIKVDVIKSALEKMNPEHGRMEVKQGLNGAKIIDDTYNANPLSFRAAIESISHDKAKKILVLGDMRELGETAVELHRECGKLAKSSGIDQIFATGELMKEFVKSFGEHAQHYNNQAELIKALLPCLSKDVLVLVKGSRSMKMENVVNAIT